MKIPENPKKKSQTNRYELYADVLRYVLPQLKKNSIAGNVIPTMPILSGIEKSLDYPPFDSGFFDGEGGI